MRTRITVIWCLVCFSLVGCRDNDSGEDEPPPPVTFTLSVSVDSGVEGFPKAGSFSYTPGSMVNYGYRLMDDYTGLSVLVGNNAVSAEGSLIMDGNKTLKVTARQMVLWKFQTAKAVYYASPAIGDDGTIYFGTGRGGTEAGAFVAITKEGTLRWNFPGDYSFFSPAIDAAGTIYVQDFGYNLFAFLPNGTLKWKLPNTLFPHMVENVGQRCPAIGADGTIYLPADGLYAISPAMEILWHFPGSKCKSSPAIGPDKTIYVVSGQDRLLALNPDGTKKWENRFTNAWEMSFAAPAVDNQGVVYVASEAFYEGKDYSALYAFNQSNGEIRWKYPTERFIRASPVIGPDRSVYIATKATDVTQTAKLISLSPEGYKNWEYVLENVHVTVDDIYSTPAVGADGLIYFGAETGFLYAVRAGNGTLAWKFDLKMAVNWSSPVLLSDGTMYIGGMGGSNYEGYIRAIKTDSPGYAVTPWPRFRHDNKNTGRFY